MKQTKTLQKIYIGRSLTLQLNHLFYAHRLCFQQLADGEAMVVSWVFFVRCNALGILVVEFFKRKLSLVGIE